MCHCVGQLWGGASPPRLTLKNALPTLVKCLLTLLSRLPHTQDSAQFPHPAPGKFDFASAAPGGAYLDENGVARGDVADDLLQAQPREVVLVTRVAVKLPKSKGRPQGACRNPTCK